MTSQYSSWSCVPQNSQAVGKQQENKAAAVIDRRDVQKVHTHLHLQVHSKLRIASELADQVWPCRWQWQARAAAYDACLISPLRPSRYRSTSTPSTIISQHAARTAMYSSPYPCLDPAWALGARKVQVIWEGELGSSCILVLVRHGPDQNHFMLMQSVLRLSPPTFRI